MQFKNLKPVFILVTALLLSYSSFGQLNYQLELTFVDHLKAGLIEQDVFIQKGEKGKQVYRVFPDEREQYLNAPLYASKIALAHDPFDRAEGGPYKRGQELGLTLGEWLQASGNATCTCEDGWGTVAASFDNLMPNAVYTFWHAFMAKDNAEDFVGTLDLPLGDRDGSHATFLTDADGKASVQVKFETCVQLTDVQLMSLIAIAYHSDGKTYGISPGPFGQATHIQLFAILPSLDEVLKKQLTTASKSGQ